MYFDEVQTILEAKPIVDNDYIIQNDERNKVLTKKTEEDAEKIAKYSGNRKDWREAVSKKFKKYDPDINNNLRGKSIKISHAYNSPNDKGDIIYKIAKKEIKKVVNGNIELKGAQEKIQNNIINKDTHNLKSADDKSDIINSLKNKDIKLIRTKVNPEKHNLLKAPSNYVWNGTGNFYVMLPPGSITYGSSNAWDGLLRENGKYYPVELKNTNEKQDTNVNLSLFVDQVNELKNKNNKIGSPIIVADSGVDFDSIRISPNIKMNIQQMNIQQIYNFLKKQNLIEIPEDSDSLKSAKERLRKKISKIERSMKNGHNIENFNNRKDFLDSIKREVSEYLFAIKKGNREKWLSGRLKGKEYLLYNSPQFNSKIKSAKATTLEKKLNNQETISLFNFLKSLGIPLKIVDTKKFKV